MSNNVNDLYTDVMYVVRSAPIENTRHGRARTVQRPIMFEMSKPDERVLFNPQRKANPYFHIMETVWMFAGANDVDFLLPFNKQIGEYANDGTINGAYGYRWRNHFYLDQIHSAIDTLQRDPESRQVVMAMWDAKIDNYGGWKDRPCNTHIYLRIVKGKLNMTVCNRSNDAVWGLAGANAVHLTYLQELIARALNVPMGMYYVMTNNLHVYEHHWGLLNAPLTWDHYGAGRTDLTVEPLPLLRPKDDWYELLIECEYFLQDKDERVYANAWLEHTVKPMYSHYMCRLNGDKDTYDLDEVQATDWRYACQLWREWHDN